MQVTDEMVERALSAYVQHPAKGDAMDAMKAALTAALAVDGLALVPCNLGKDGGGDTSAGRLTAFANDGEDSPPQEKI